MRRLASILSSVMLMLLMPIEVFATETTEINVADNSLVSIASGHFNKLTDDEISSLNIKSKNILLTRMDLKDSANSKYAKGGEMYDKDADNEVEIASLTKIMTALVYISDKQSGVADLNSDSADDFLDQKVTITADMLDTHYEYVKMYLEVGQTVTVRDLLYGLMLPSAADAAMSLAIDDAGSMEKFVAKMNDFVSKNNLKHTHFSNPYGMGKSDMLAQYPNATDPENYSSARDMTAILNAALSYPVFEKIFTTNNYTTSYGANLIKTISQTAKNDSIDVSIIKGAKTGYAEDAGRCLASIADLDGIRFILINLGAPESTGDYISDAASIYNYVDKNFHLLTALTKDDVVASLPVSFGLSKTTYDITGYEDIYVYGRIGTKFTAKFDGISKIKWGTKQGESLGNIKISASDEEVASVPVVLNEEIKYVNFPGIVLGVGAALFVIFFIKFYKKKKSDWEKMPARRR